MPSLFDRELQEMVANTNPKFDLTLTGESQLHLVKVAVLWANAVAVELEIFPEGQNPFRREITVAENPELHEQLWKMLHTFRAMQQYLGGEVLRERAPA